MRMREARKLILAQEERVKKLRAALAEADAAIQKMAQERQGLIADILSQSGKLEGMKELAGNIRSMKGQVEGLDGSQSPARGRTRDLATNGKASKQAEEVTLDMAQVVG